MIFGKRSEKVEQISGLELAQKQMLFVEDMVPLDEEENVYSVMTCDGAKLKDEDGKFDSYAWAFLAYSSMYDATQDQKYVEPIRQIEEHLYKEYARETNNKEPSIDIVKMVYFLEKSYSMLQGKNVISNDVKFKDELLVGPITEFMDSDLAGLPDDVFEVPAVPIVSMSLSSMADYFENPARNEIYKVSQNYMFRSKAVTDFEGKDKMCWSTLADYNLLNKQSSDISSINEFILDSENIIDLVDFQPCFDVVKDMNLKTNDKSYDKILQNLYNKYFDGSMCSIEGVPLYSLSKGETLLPNIAYEVYLNSK